MAEQDDPPAGARLTEASALTQLALRGRPGAELLGRVREASGLALPFEPNTTTAQNGLTALWLGPDEWLLLAPAGTAPDLVSRLSGILTAVDVSASRTGLDLSGPAARAVLEKGCGLDLHPRAFRAGLCAQTLLARVPVILHQTAEAPSYRILVRRSYARYLSDWLVAAAAP